ncbi:MAG: hypothetical protein E7478_07205 [Ruminococcaceae bacterium]|nr:hypothetical protein [Oscillospiraceae bacterium]
MKKLEEYTGEKVYAFPNGARATREAVLQRFPAAEDFTFVVTTDEYGEVMFGMDNLSALRSIYNIDKSLSKEDAIAAIEEIMNTPAEVNEEVSDQTRIADALEDMVVLQELNALEA